MVESRDPTKQVVDYHKGLKKKDKVNAYINIGPTMVQVKRRLRRTETISNTFVATGNYVGSRDRDLRTKDELGTTNEKGGRAPSVSSVSDRGETTSRGDYVSSTYFV